MIAHKVRRFTVRDLPDDITLIEIDGRNGPIRRLEQIQTLNV